MAKISEQEIVSYESILKQAVKKRRGPYRFSTTYPAYALLLIMLALSLFIYYNFEQKLKNDRRATFEKAINSVVTRVQIAYNDHLTVANSIRSLYDNLVQVVRDYLLLYASMPSKTYPSILSFSSVQKVPQYRLTEFEYYVQGQGYFHYKVYPRTPKEVFYPIEFMIPEEPNEKYRGLDISTVEGIKPWFFKAIEEGKPFATNVFYFRNSDTLSMFFIYPIYDNSFPHESKSGRIIAFKTAFLMELDITKFFEFALGKAVPTDTLIYFRIYEKQNDDRIKNLFFSSNYSSYANGPQPALQETYTFLFLDKPIQIDFFTVPDFEGAFQRYLPLISLAVSLLLSFVFFGFVLAVSTSRARAIDLAERITRSQRRILESTKDVIGVLDFNGVWKTINPASKEMFEYEPTELIGSKIDSLFVNKADIDNFYNFPINTTEEFTKKVDYLMKTASGQYKWINWSFTFSPQDGLIYSIGRDITNG